MNATDLRKLAGRLSNHGLRVVALEPELRLHATNPFHNLLTEEIVAEGSRYLTSFSYEIGERRREKPGADRIARPLVPSRVATAGAM